MRKRTKRVLAGLILGSGAGIVGITAACEAPPAEQAQQADQREVKTAGVGDRVRSGDAAITVTGVDTKQSIGQDFLAEEARGKYVIVRLTVKNIGESPLDFFAGTTPLVDQKDREYTSTVDVALLGGEESDLIEPINPGSKAKGFIAYDVPESVKVNKSHVELTGDFLAESVKVDLR